MRRDRSAVQPGVDGEALRNVMRRMPSAVTVVTVGGAQERRGITIGSFASTSLEPPLISFNVEKNAQMHGVLAAADRYAVHLLGEDHAHLSDRFAMADRTGAEQFDGIAFHVDAYGTPLLDGVLGVLHCVHYGVYDAGDHSIFVGEVVDIEDGADGGPLLYFNRAYRRVGEPVAPPGFLAPPVNRASSDAR